MTMQVMLLCIMVTPTTSLHLKALLKKLTLEEAIMMMLISMPVEDKDRLYYFCLCLYLKNYAMFCNGVVRLKTLEML